jgi:phosphoribosylanthranilate isomerase
LHYRLKNSVYGLLKKNIPFDKVIQIAGVIDEDEAEMLAACGVDLIGFPLRLTVNQEDLSENDAANIISQLVPTSKAVLITYLNNAEEIVKLSRTLGVHIVQIHGDISLEEISLIKNMCPNLPLIKSLIVKRNNMDELKNSVQKYTTFVDAFITDTFDPETGASGATGKTHDWSISRRIVEISTKPVILAGGLNPNNVREAILTTKPAGVDSHTGVEDSNGRKNRSLVEAFIKNARMAFSEISQSLIST